MHATGRPYVASALTFGLFGWRHGWSRRASLVAAATMALCFRDPRRVPPATARAVVAPADGVVVGVDESVPPEDLGLGGEALPRVTIATSVVDPYVHRAPVSGHVSYAAEDASSLVIETGDGVAVGLVHTPGLVGRVTLDLQPGDEVALGQTYGLVPFGSRVELFLPSGSRVQPLPGQRMVGGETVLAVLGA
jgi:phosphatidylserine decarboxylase